MHRRARTIASFSTILALLLMISPLTALAGGSRLEGLVVGLDGRSAEGLAVHLIDDGGKDIGRAAIDESGMYRFGDLEAGAYGLGVENSSGQMAPVAGPQIKLGANELARRDLKLLNSGDERGGGGGGGSNYSVGEWWAGLTPAAKAWTVVAIVVVAGVTVAVLSDDNASPFVPETQQ